MEDAIEEEEEPKRVQCLRSCDLIDFHQELIPYEVAWSLQKHIVKEKKSQIQNEGDCNDTLIVLQHPSVFTLGTASSNNNLNFDIQNPPFDIHRTERGGEVTYHGPGQVAIFFVINLIKLLSLFLWVFVFWFGIKL
jgi:lipoyl(octanoyl) transferase